MRRAKILVPALLVVLLASWAAAQTVGLPAAELKGWEHDSPYGKLFKPAERDRIKGRIESIVDIQPMPGMAPGVGLTVRDKADGSPVTVHLGPRAFIDPQAAGLRKGDEVKISGSWAEIGGKDFFLAGKLKKGEQTEIKLRRTSDGKPYWGMTPEEMEKAKSSDSAAKGP